MWLHPEIRTLVDIPRHWSDRRGEHPALRAGDLVVTWHELERSSNQMAHALLARGVAHGNVCFIGSNVPEFWMVWLAANKAQAAFVPLSWQSSDAELAALITDADPRVLVVEQEYAATVALAIAESDVDPVVVGFTTRSSGGPGLDGWCSTQAVSDPGLIVRSTDTAVIAYTPGTTGPPKGVMVRHEAFNISFLSEDLEPSIDASQDDVNLQVMPNFELTGCWVSIPTLYHGGTVVLLPRFDPEAVLNAIHTYRPNTLYLTPARVRDLLGHASGEVVDAGALRTLIYSGSPILAEEMDAAMALLGCDLRQLYGTTETYVITMLRPADHRVQDGRDLRSSCGSTIPLVHTRIVDAEDNDVPDGEVGQVVVRTPGIMAGYFRQPEETAKVLRAGWYWTGDRAYRSPSGHHYLVGRIANAVPATGA
jgi:acyl-CoA synthetase (AMP-forming)/AMP-acid ligase II